jgi:hypothetical protein
MADLARLAKEERDAKKLERKFKEEVRLQGVPRSRPVGHIVTRGSVSDEYLLRFTRMSYEALENLMLFLPLVDFLNLRGTCRFFARLFQQDRTGVPLCKLLWEVEFDCLKVSFSFIKDFRAFQNYMLYYYANDVLYQANKSQIWCIHKMYRNYFGIGLMVSGKHIHVFDSFPAPVVSLGCLFLGMPGPELRDNFGSNMVEDLEDWLWGCVRNIGNGVNPMRCIETLSVAGFFATYHSRSRFVEELILIQSFHHMSPQPYEWGTTRLLVLIEFLIRLACESYELRRYTVDSRAWGTSTYGKGVMSVVQLVSVENCPLVGVSAKDFEKLKIEFVARYGTVFGGMNFTFKW